MAFGTLCSSRLVHGFNCKANKPIIFTKRFWNNTYLIGAFVLGWLLITALQEMFKVQTLTVAQLMTVYGLALLNLPVIQLLKWIRTRKK
jgi:Ca2+-transporting ATPase